MIEIASGLNNWDQIIKEVSKDANWLFDGMSLEEMDEMYDDWMR